MMIFSVSSGLLIMAWKATSAISSVETTGIFPVGTMLVMAPKLMMP